MILGKGGSMWQFSESIEITEIREVFRHFM